MGLLSCFAKTHRLVADFAAYTQGKDVTYWLDVLKDYRIDLNYLAEKGAYCLDFSLISLRDKDPLINTVTVSIGEYDFITLNVDQNGSLINIPREMTAKQVYAVFMKTNIFLFLLKII